MTELKKVKLRDILVRSKIPIQIENATFYKRVTIRTKHQGVSLRDIEIGEKIGTKQQFVLRAGQFVMSKIDARYGAFGITPVEVHDAIITGNFWAYDINEELASVEWINNYTNSPSFYDLCERASSGITHRKYLDEEFFLEHELWLPERNSQNETLQRLETRQKLTHKLDAEFNNQSTYLTQLRQAILQEAIEGKLTARWRAQHPVQSGNPEFDAAALLSTIKAEKQKLIAEKKIAKEQPLPPIREDEMPFELPKGWVWCRPSDIADPEKYSLGIGPFGSDLKVSDYVASGVPLIFVRNITQDDFDLNPRYVSKEKARALSAHLVKSNDILITKMGDPPGDCAIYPTNKPNGIITADCIRFRVSQTGSNRYIYYSIKSDLIQGQLVSITKGMAQKKISLERFKSVSIPLPSLAEQRAIVERVDRLLAMVDELAAQVAERKEQTEALMQAVLREAFQPTPP